MPKSKMAKARIWEIVLKPDSYARMDLYFRNNLEGLEESDFPLGRCDYIILRPDTSPPAKEFIVTGEFLVKQAIEEMGK